MIEAYIFDAVRTPRGKGKKDGSLHQATPVWLLRTLLQGLQQRHNLDTSLVDDVILGCVTPVGEQGADIARTAVLDAGWADHADQPHILPRVQRRAITGVGKAWFPTGGNWFPETTHWFHD